jgi:hypothetical protein
VIEGAGRRGTLGGARWPGEALSDAGGGIAQAHVRAVEQGAMADWAKAALTRVGPRRARDREAAAGTRVCSNGLSGRVLRSTLLRKRNASGFSI